MNELTNKEKDLHKNANVCWISKTKFIKYRFNFRKDSDHDHYTGKYRGAAHSLCNLRYLEQRNITIGMHNGSNYDFHLTSIGLQKNLML